MVEGAARSFVDATLVRWFRLLMAAASVLDAAVPLNVVVFNSDEVEIVVRAVERTTTSVEFRCVASRLEEFATSAPIVGTLQVVDSLTTHALPVRCGTGADQADNRRFRILVPLAVPPVVTVVCTIGNRTQSVQVQLHDYWPDIIPAEPQRLLTPNAHDSDRVEVELVAGRLPTHDVSLIAVTGRSTCLVSPFSQRFASTSALDAMVDLLTVGVDVFSFRVRAVLHRGAARALHPAELLRPMLWLETAHGSTPSPMIYAKRTWGSALLEVAVLERGLPDHRPILRSTISETIAVRLDRTSMTGHLLVRLADELLGAGSAPPIEIPLALIRDMQDRA